MLTIWVCLEVCSTHLQYGTHYIPQSHYCFRTKTHRGTMLVRYYWSLLNSLILWYRPDMSAMGGGNMRWLISFDSSCTFDKHAYDSLIMCNLHGIKSPNLITLEVLYVMSFLNHPGPAAHKCLRKISHHWFSYWLGVWSAPSHYLNDLCKMGAIFVGLGVLTMRSCQPNFRSESICRRWWKDRPWSNHIHCFTLM